MYSDEIKKIEYYKEKIIALYLNDNKIINKDELQKKIDNIDLKLAVFKQGYIENGEILNLKKFNEQKADIYYDLKVLYELAYELAKEKLTFVQAKIDYKINSLQEKAKYYKYRNDLESASIFGKSVYYATNGFNQSYENGDILISLGSLNINSGSYLICQLDCSEVDKKDIIFTFDDLCRVGDYRYNKDLLPITGNYNINNYNFKLKENTSTSFKIEVEKLRPNNNNKYNVFGGKDKIKVYYPSENRTEFINKVANIPFVADKDCQITFYVYGASEINLSINDKYDYKSHDEYEIKSPKKRQKFLYRAQQGFILDFNTDGTLYSEKTTGYIQDESLYSKNGFGTLVDFMLEEIAYGEPIKFKDVVVRIKNAPASFIDINYISIKEAQISELENDY